VCVEVVNEVAPANSSVVLNCTLPRDSAVTWSFNDKHIDLSDDSYTVEDGNLHVKVVGECQMFIVHEQC